MNTLLAAAFITRKHKSLGLTSLPWHQKSLWQCHNALLCKDQETLFLSYVYEHQQCKFGCWCSRIKGQ